MHNEERIPYFKYIADEDKKIFHYDWCEALESINKDKLKKYSTTKKARKEGYKPCPSCKPFEDYDPSVYWGDTESKKCHCDWCKESKNMNKDKIRKFSTTKKAIKEGFEPCDKCRPWEVRFPYWGNTESKKCHCSSCNYLPKNINKEKYKGFYTTKEAIEENFQPCLFCKPWKIQGR